MTQARAAAKGPAALWIAVLVLLLAAQIPSLQPSLAQSPTPKKQAPQGRPAPSLPPPSPPMSRPTPPVSPPATEAREIVQADVSTRSVAITAGFTGTQVVVFGAIENSRQMAAESGFYDLVVVLEGPPTRLIARKKSNVGGIWVNSQSVTYRAAPSYYAVVSTRPVDEIASEEVLQEHEIGYEHLRLEPAKPHQLALPKDEIRAFRRSVIRIKERDGLYRKDEYGVAFSGRSLFRAQINLPANVPVGPFDTNVYLFREGKLLSQYTSRILLEREGLERFVHTMAHQQPLIYGIVTVIIAVASGLLASYIFRAAKH